MKVYFTSNRDTEIDLLEPVDHQFQLKYQNGVNSAGLSSTCKGQSSNSRRILQGVCICSEVPPSNWRERRRSVMKVDQDIGKREKSDNRAPLDSSHNVCGEMCKDSRMLFFPFWIIITWIQLQPFRTMPSRCIYQEFISCSRYRIRKEWMIRVNSLRYSNKQSVLPSNRPLQNIREVTTLFTTVLNSRKVNKVSLIYTEMGSRGVHQIKVPNRYLRALASQHAGTNRSGPYWMARYGIPLPVITAWLILVQFAEGEFYPIFFYNLQAVGAMISLPSWLVSICGKRRGKKMKVNMRVQWICVFFPYFAWSLFSFFRNKE